MMEVGRLKVMLGGLRVSVQGEVVVSGSAALDPELWSEVLVVLLMPGIVKLV